MNVLRPTRSTVFFLFIFSIGLPTTLIFQNCGGEFSALNMQDTSLKSLEPGAYAHTSSEPIQLHHGPSELTNQAKAIFVLTRAPSITFEGDRFSCKVDSQAPTNCASFVTRSVEIPSGTHVQLDLSGLSDGTHTFIITDTATNKSIAVVNWKIDTVAPVVVINPISAINTSRNDLQLEVTAQDASDITSLLCRLDTATFAPCVAPIQLNALTVGTHVYEAKAVDAAGNESLPTQLQFTVFPPEPNTLNFTRLPEVETQSTSAQFAFQKGTNITRVMCAVDGQPEQQCTNGLSLSALSLGAHSIVATGYSATNTSVAQLNFTWTIIQPPIFMNFVAHQTVLSPPAGQTTYDLTVQAPGARVFTWEISGKTSFTTEGTVKVAVSTNDSNRFIPYCVTAKNGAGEVRTCGTLTLSRFGINADNTGFTYAGTALHSSFAAEIRTAEFRPIGVRFATDGLFVYSGTSARFSAIGTVKALSLSHIAINNEVFDWADARSYVQRTVSVIDPTTKRPVVVPTTPPVPVRLAGATPNNWSLIRTDNLPAEASASRLARVGNQLFSRGVLIPELNASVLSWLPDPHSSPQFIKDGSSVFAARSTEPTGYQKIVDANAATFAVTNLTGYYADRSKIYYLADGTVLSHTAATDRLSAFGVYWITDGTQIFYQGKLVEGVAMPATLLNRHMFTASGKVVRLFGVVPGVSAAGIQVYTNGNSPTYYADAVGFNGKVYGIAPKSNALTEVPGANPAQFRSLGANPTDIDGYWTDDDQTFHFRYDSVPDRIEVRDLGLHPLSDLVVRLDNFIIRSNKGVYHRGLLMPVRDPLSFTSINSKFYKDSQTVYGVFGTITDLNVSPNGFETTGWSYGKNCLQNKVVYDSGTVPGADCATFRGGANSSYGKDANNCYLLNQVIGPASHASCAGF